MFRIKDPNAAPVPPTGGPEPITHPDDPAETPGDAEPDMDLGAKMAQVSPDVARYLGPDQRCKSCSFWMDQGECQMVSGPIDPEGSCSLYTALDSGGEGPAPEVAPEAPPEMGA